MVNTGPGKGKTTAALGAALRAAGQGLQVAIVQFIKNAPTGELTALENVPGIEIRQLGLGRIVSPERAEGHRAAAEAAWRECRAMAASGDWDMIVFDEICVALHYGLISSEEVLALVRNRPAGLHMILTGRHCPKDVLAEADTVTHMDAVRHHLSAGVKAQPGVEY